MKTATNPFSTAAIPRNRGDVNQGLQPVITSWDEVDLVPVIEGRTTDEPPTILQRSDKKIGLLYAGKLHSLAGETESLKTWVAMRACAARMALSEHVLYLDFEDSKTTAVERLRALGIPDAIILEFFHYIRPDDALVGATVERFETGVLRAHPYTLAILDGLTEALELHGLDLRDNNDVAKFVALVPRRIQRTGPAVFSLDHTTKDPERRGRFAIGAQHKLAGLDGAAYSLEVIRAGGRGQESVSRLTVTKDRPGFVRAASLGGKIVGEVHKRENPDTGFMEITVEPPPPTFTDPLDLSPAERRVLNALGTVEAPMYPREIGDRIVEQGWAAGLSREVCQRALRELAQRGLADSADHRWWRCGDEV
jgi:hypothetical protein